MPSPSRAQMESNQGDQFQYEEETMDPDDDTYTSMNELTKSNLSFGMLTRPSVWMKEQQKWTAGLVAFVVACIVWRSSTKSINAQQNKARSILTSVLIAMVVYVSIQSLNKQRKKR